MNDSRRERTKRAIMAAAKTIVQQAGHDAVTVRNVAEMTGYAYTNLYYYFRDLESLLWSLRLEMIEDMMRKLQASSPQNADPVEEVIDTFSSFANYFLDNPNIFRFFYFHAFIQPDGDNRYQALERRLQGTWQTTFSRLIQNGVVPAKDLEIVAKTIIYAIQGLIMLNLSSGSVAKRETIERDLSEIIRHLFQQDAEKP